MSPWNDFGRAVREISGDYVTAVFAEESWWPEQARADLHPRLGGHRPAGAPGILTILSLPQSAPPVTSDRRLQPYSGP
jgi:hypothetical protein